MEQVQVTDFESLVENLAGHNIVSGEQTPEGIHFYLEDGRVLIFDGVFTIGFGRLSNHRLQ